jgi:hypothetical protein
MRRHLLGIDVESTPLVALAAVASMGLALTPAELAVARLTVRPAPGSARTLIS